MGTEAWACASSDGGSCPAQHDDQPIISIENLTKVYPGGVRAVDDVTLDVAEGEIFGLLGPNGAGKTTTIAVLTTLIKPTSGAARVAGMDVARHPMRVRMAFGYVSQDLAVDEELTGRENLVLQAGFYHLPRQLAEQRIHEVLELVALTDRRNTLVQTYSGGMRKRLDIACGLLHRPRILFLDEPTLGLDIQTRHEIWRYVTRLREESGMTIFMTTHYMDEADHLCDRVAIIDYGKIRAIGHPADLKNQVGGDVITVALEDGAGLPEEALRSMDLVVSVKTVGKEHTIVARDGEKAVPPVLETIRASGARVSRVSLKRPSLDDVFLAFTGRELREEVGSPEEIRRARIAMRRARR